MPPGEVLSPKWGFRYGKPVASRKFNIAGSLPRFRRISEAAPAIAIAVLCIVLGRQRFLWYYGVVRIVEHGKWQARLP